MEDSVEVLEAPLPAIVSVTAEINKPRIPSLTQILRAGKKPVQEWKSGDIGLASGQAKEVTVVSNLAPVEQRKQVIFETKVEQDVTSLVDALTKEGVWQRLMANILVFSEKDDVAAELLSGAARLKGSGKVAALMMGQDTGSRAANLFAFGADTVYAAQQRFPA